MERTETEHFDTSQKLERERLRILFEKRLQYQGCKKITYTSELTYSDYDAFMFSGLSNNIFSCFMEMKVRTVTAKHYPDSIIEYHKFEKLYEYYEINPGNKILYVVDYTDMVVIWVLNPLYAFLKNNGYPLDTWFTSLQCQRNGYTKEPKDKRVRNLQYHEASYYINKLDYSLMTYNEFLNFK